MDFKTKTQYRQEISVVWGMIDQLKAENAALKEDVAQLKSTVQHEADCVDSAAEEINRQSADLIESQAAEIAELDALRNDAVLRLDTYKALCDQMGNALEEVTALALCGKKDQLPGRCDQITKIAYKTLKAWRAMK